MLSEAKESRIVVESSGRLGLGNLVSLRGDQRSEIINIPKLYYYKYSMFWYLIASRVPVEHSWGASAALVFQNVKMDVSGLAAIMENPTTMTEHPLRQKSHRHFFSAAHCGGHQRKRLKCYNVRPSSAPTRPDWLPENATQFPTPQQQQRWCSLSHFCGKLLFLLSHSVYGDTLAHVRQTVNIIWLLSHLPALNGNWKEAIFYWIVFGKK